jgi:hypothetical protein
MLSELQVNLHYVKNCASTRVEARERERLEHTCPRFISPVELQMDLLSLCLVLSEIGYLFA